MSGADGYDFIGGAASSAMDFIGNNIMANSANAKSKRAAAAQAALNYHYTTMLMDKQNEYNKPINQMARLREAGLNPNLVYGDGGATMASATGSMSVGQADVTPSSGTLNVLGKMQMLNTMKQQDANIKETEARTNAIDDNIALKEKELEWRKEYDRENLNIQRALLASQLGLRGAQQQKINAEVEYLGKKTPVTFSSDPAGYVIDLGTRVGEAYNSFYDYVRDEVAPKLFKKKGGR